MNEVKVFTTKEGWYYEANGKRLGPYSVEDLNKIDFKEKMAIEIGVEIKDIVRANLKHLQRTISVEELREIISTTVKHDNPTKIITFLTMLLTFTEEDQGNLALQSESSTGKSYIPLELCQYFPKEDVHIYGGASPTAFFHEVGTWEEERKAIIVDLEKKILIFLDQPHYTLLEKLRPLLSHDQKELMYKIVDKKQKHGHRTKTVIIRGYPTVIFLSTKFAMDEQERTRVFILSPDQSEVKIIDSINLLGKKLGNRDTFKDELQRDARRIWLKQRVSAIKNTGIRNVIIDNPDALCKAYIKSHKHLISRLQRDFPRFIGLIKAHALLNWAHRERLPNNCIKATNEDIKIGFRLYHEIATPNELGISPRIFEIYQQVINPLFKKKNFEGLDKNDILKDYRMKYHRPLSFRTLRDEILPTLEGADLVRQDIDPNDRRRTLTYPPDARDISPNETEKICPKDQGDNSEFLKVSQGACEVCGIITLRTILGPLAQPIFLCSDECERNYKGRI